jgi:ubiquitin carboxyl-terminal hydrolase 10
MGDLKGPRGSGGLETGADATPVADATVRFFEEFALKEPPQQATSGPRGPDEAKKEHNAMDSFEPTYIYDAMKEKRQLRNLLVCSRAT